MVTSTSTSLLTTTLRLAFFSALVIQVVLGNLYEGDKYVKSFDKYSSFEKDVIRGDGVWMVQFFSPTCPHCKKVVNDYKKVAEITAGIYNIAAVDMSTEAGMRIGDAYKVDSYPTFLMFGDEKTPSKYNGARNAQEMVQKVFEFAVETMKVRAGDPSAKKNSSNGSSGAGGGGGSSKVVHLTSENFQKEVLDSPMVSMVAFTAPWCGHCKKLQPDWEAAAQKLDGEGAFLGWVDATAETQLASMYGVKGYPTIKLFPGGAGKSFQSAIDYNGGRTITDIVSAVLAEVDRTGVPKELPQLISADVLKEECSGSNHICVLAALPHILDSGASGRNNYKDLISKVAKTFRGSAFSFLWFEGTSQPELEQALELSFGFPAIVAFSMDREAYAVMRGSFTERGISSFLHGVTSGRQPTIKLSQMPTVVTTEPWDGKDGEIIEEELSLEEIMGWDDDDDDKNNDNDNENGNGDEGEL